MLSLSSSNCEDVLEVLHSRKKFEKPQMIDELCDTSFRKEFAQIANAEKDYHFAFNHPPPFAWNVVEKFRRNHILFLAKIDSKFCLHFTFFRMPTRLDLFTC